MALSTQANWVSQLRDQAAQTEGVRAEEVVRAQQEIADGTLEQNIDVESMISSLLMEL